MLRKINISSAHRKPEAQVHEMPYRIRPVSDKAPLWSPSCQSPGSSDIPEVTRSIFLTKFDQSSHSFWFSLKCTSSFLKFFFCNFWKLFSSYSLLHPTVCPSSPPVQSKKGGVLPSMPGLPCTTLLALALFCIHFLLPHFLHAAHCESDTGCYMRCTEMLYY